MISMSDEEQLRTERRTNCENRKSLRRQLNRNVDVYETSTSVSSANRGTAISNPSRNPATTAIPIAKKPLLNTPTHKHTTTTRNTGSIRICTRCDGRIHTRRTHCQVDSRRLSDFRRWLGYVGRRAAVNRTQNQPRKRRGCGGNLT